MSVRIGQVKNIPIRLHFTFLISFVLIAWTLATSFMPNYFGNLSEFDYWVMGGIGAIVLFVSVLLHELAHSLVALRYGIKVRQIMLFIFGGVSDIAQEARDFTQEVKLAAAGPITSFVLAGIFAACWWLSAPMFVATSPILEGILFYGAVANAILGAFNLIPAFPLDGGRILRALLHMWKRNYDDATRMVERVGMGISYGFMALGFLALVFARDFIGSLWLLLIGWFINMGAASYLAQHHLTSILSNVRLGQFMNTNIISVSDDDTIDDLYKKYFTRYMKHEFPVTNRQGYLVGMVDLKRLMQVPETKRVILKASDIMTSRSDLVIMDPDRNADDALMQMNRSQQGKVFICNKEGRLVGLVSKTDIINVAGERQQFVEAIRNLQKEERHPNSVRYGQYYQQQELA